MQLVEFALHFRRPARFVHQRPIGSERQSDAFERTLVDRAHSAGDEDAAFKRDHMPARRERHAARSRRNVLGDDDQLGTATIRVEVRQACGVALAFAEDFLAAKEQESRAGERPVQARAHFELDLRQDARGGLVDERDPASVARGIRAHLWSNRLRRRDVRLVGRVE